jgi:hypothetical protein
MKHLTERLIGLALLGIAVAVIAVWMFGVSPTTLGQDMAAAWQASVNTLRAFVQAVRR